MTLTYIALPTETVRALQSGAPDANGQVPERAISGGAGYPCRHCLCQIPEGAPMLIMAHRPFGALQPYAECGPIFLCAEPCTRHDETQVPQILTTSPSYLVKGYSADERIVYGTGEIVTHAAVADHATTILERPEVAWVHARSARNNCYLCRIERG